MTIQHFLHCLDHQCAKAQREPQKLNVSDMVSYYPFFLPASGSEIPQPVRRRNAERPRAAFFHINYRLRHPS